MKLVTALVAREQPLSNDMHICQENIFYLYAPHVCEKISHRNVMITKNICRPLTFLKQCCSACEVSIESGPNPFATAVLPCLFNSFPSNRGATLTYPNKHWMFFSECLFLNKCFPGRCRKISSCFAWASAILPRVNYATSQVLNSPPIALPAQPTLPNKNMAHISSIILTYSNRICLRARMLFPENVFVLWFLQEYVTSQIALSCRPNLSAPKVATTALATKGENILRTCFNYAIPPGCPSKPQRRDPSQTPFWNISVRHPCGKFL